MRPETPRAFGHSGPRRQVMLALVLTVLLAHAALLVGTGTHLLSGAPGPGKNTLPLQTRLLPPPSTPALAPPPVASPVSPRNVSVRHTARLAPAAPAGQPVTPHQDTPTTDRPEVASAAHSAASEASAASAPMADSSATPNTPATRGKAEGERPADTGVATSTGTAVVQPSSPSLPNTGPSSAANRAPLTETGSDGSSMASTASVPGPALAAPGPASQGQGQPLQVSPAHLPPSVLLSYDMTGMDKGLRYHANGELQWQHDGRRYALTLSVRAFLVGSRHWRSRGSIGPDGLAPARFSDTRRSELAAHFDRAGQRVVFSNNAPAAPLQAGAQDQISLYVQLAAAMNGQPDAFAVGRQVQIQTATVRDALPWQLTLEQQEVLQVDGQPVTTFKWVCLPRQRFDSRIEFWSSPQHHGLPARIRITQASGSYIDMQLRSLQPLAALAAEPGLGEKTTSP